MHIGEPEKGISGVRWHSYLKKARTLFLSMRKCKLEFARSFFYPIPKSKLIFKLHVANTAKKRISDQSDQLEWRVERLDPTCHGVPTKFREFRLDCELCGHPQTVHLRRHSVGHFCRIFFSYRRNKVDVLRRKPNIMFLRQFLTLRKQSQYVNPRWESNLFQ